MPTPARDPSDRGSADMAVKRRGKDEGGIYECEVGRWVGQYVVETLTEAKRSYLDAKTCKR
jgi:hypothetical protein